MSRDAGQRAASDFGQRDQGDVSPSSDLQSCSQQSIFHTRAMHYLHCQTLLRRLSVVIRCPQCACTVRPHASWDIVLRLCRFLEHSGSDKNGFRVCEQLHPRFCLQLQAASLLSCNLLCLSRASEIRDKSPTIVRMENKVKSPAAPLKSCLQLRLIASLTDIL